MNLMFTRRRVALFFLLAVCVVTFGACDSNESGGKDGDGREPAASVAPSEGDRQEQSNDETDGPSEPGSDETSTGESGPSAHPPVDVVVEHLRTEKVFGMLVLGEPSAELLQRLSEKTIDETKIAVVTTGKATAKELEAEVQRARIDSVTSIGVWGDASLDELEPAPFHRVLLVNFYSNAEAVADVPQKLRNALRSIAKIHVVDVEMDAPESSNLPAKEQRRTADAIAEDFEEADFNVTRPRDDEMPFHSLIRAFTDEPE